MQPLITPPALAVFLDYASVIVFAISGALVASRKQLDLVGFIFIAFLTATGGGTLRDLFLGRDPVFWIARPEIAMLCAGVAVLVFFTAHLFESRYRALLWFDAVALAVAVPAGVAVARGLGQGPVVVLIMAMVTGCFGGLMRDVVCNEVPLVLKKGELYLTAAFCGALAAVVCGRLGIHGDPALWACGVTTFLLRAGALIWGWKLPVYKSRPPKVEVPKRLWWD